jgi:hypothetical protein
VANQLRKNRLRLDKAPQGLGLRVVWGACWGLYIGLFLSIFSIFDDSSVSLIRSGASLAVGGTLGGGLYASMMLWITNKARAAVVMSGAASAGWIVIFYGWGFPDFVLMGLLVGGGSGLTFGVLIWRQSS